MVGRRGRNEFGRGFLPGAATLLALVLLLGAAGAAQARVTLVATGTPELVFLGIPKNEVVARLALPGPARAVAVSRDGARGYVTAAAEIVALDVNTRLETGRSALGVVAPEIGDLELSPRGETLYAVRGTHLLVLDAQTLAQRALIDLRGEGVQLAVAGDGRTAAVTLTSGHVAMVALDTNTLLRRVKLKGALGVAIADTGVTYVTARNRLRVIARGQRRARKKAIKLPAGAGGGLAFSPGRTQLAVGAAPGGASGAIFHIGRSSVRRLVAGRGPGRAAWYPSAVRIAMADGGAATVSLVSPFSGGRVASIPLAGTTPLDVVVQPGLAVTSGTEGPDQITGSRSDDKLHGLGGDDVLRGGRGRDVLDGGPGNDTLAGGNNSDAMNGGEGDDTMAGSTGNDVMLGGLGADNLDGGTGNDSLEGEDGDDQLDGGDGDDSILGGPGNDTIIEKGFGDDKLLDGGVGNDVIKGGRGSEQMILGGDGEDELYGETGSERILGGPGNDLIDGGRAGDRLEGDDGDDVIKGDAGNDHLYGRVGNDKLDAGSGTDELVGEAGNDELVGGSGIDVFDGGPGDDVIRAADDSPDTGTCGEGNDTLYVEADNPTRDALTGCETVISVAAEPDSDAATMLTIRGTRHPDRLTGSIGDDSIFGRGGADRIYGMAGNDYVDGDANHDRLHGGDGDDLIAGRKGNDTIWGDAGNDRITGDRGRDRILGGAGNDEIFGNYDPDEIDGGTGNDRINVIHGGADAVVCGRGRDVVYVDARDRISADCEIVRR